MSFFQDIPEEIEGCRDYDVAIYGAGYIGFALATHLAATKLKVLLVETSGQLLWESTAALENRLGGEARSCSALVDWLNVKGKRLSSYSLLDPVQMEILAAVELKELAEQTGFDVSFYEAPVGANVIKGQIESVYFAGKSGVRAVRSKLWVDASEVGELTTACLSSNQLVGRFPDTEYYSMCLHSANLSEVRADVNTFAAAVGAECLDSAIASECQLRWSGCGANWHQEIERSLTQLRGYISKEIELAVSHTSSKSFPTYSEVVAENDQLDVLPINLKSLCPQYLACSIQSISERFQIGYEAVFDCLTAINELNSLPKTDGACVSMRPAVVETVDVLVAGAGTAGSMAGIAAAEKGVSTCMLDFADAPGGVGTVSGITCYFFGLPGGLQERINVRTNQLTACFLGKKSPNAVWHQDAKKIALLEAFEACGAKFIGGSILCGVRMSDSRRVDSVYFAKGGQLTEIRAKSFIDSTGDADLCSFAGAETRSGRIGDHRSLAYSQASLTVKNNGSKVLIRNQNFDAGWLNAGETIDLTRARLNGVAQYATITWDADICLRTIAPSLGIRQSRTVKTDYVLKLSDLMAHREFSDAFGEASAHADTHSVDFEFEDDEAVFYYWVCRLFRRQLRTQLPYRMLLPIGLDNVWVACRAAGMETNAFYAIRMQRDMQRLGEAAGKAAALACSSVDVADSRSVDVADFEMAIEDHRSNNTEDSLTLLESLRSGDSGGSLWRVYEAPEVFRTEVVELLASGDLQSSFHAACLLAMWGDSRAEPRFIEAITTKEFGSVKDKNNRGAYGQEIDIPHWLLAIILLRRCGSEACVPSLEAAAESVGQVLNSRTAIALTVESLLQKASISIDSAMRIVKHLQKSPPLNTPLPASYSIARYLRGEAQMVLPNDVGANASEGHLWQFDLVLARIHQQMALPPMAKHLSYLSDPRGFVRLPFRKLFKAGNHSVMLVENKSDARKTVDTLEHAVRLG